MTQIVIKRFTHQPNSTKYALVKTRVTKHITKTGGHTRASSVSGMTVVFHCTNPGCNAAWTSKSNIPRCSNPVPDEVKETKQIYHHWTLNINKATKIDKKDWDIHLKVLLANSRAFTTDHRHWPTTYNYGYQEVIVVPDTTGGSSTILKHTHRPWIRKE